MATKYFVFRGHFVFRGQVTTSQAVLEIEYPHEALGGSLIVDWHELCNSRAALPEFGVRADGLNNGNADPEGFNFLHTDVALYCSGLLRCRPFPVFWIPRSEPTGEWMAVMGHGRRDHGINHRRSKPARLLCSPTDYAAACPSTRKRLCNVGVIHALQIGDQSRADRIPAQILPRLFARGHKISASEHG
jgi:hypothetical protein